MRHWRVWGMAGALWLAGSGCASGPGPGPAATRPGATPVLVLPLALRGQDTEFRLNVPPPGHANQTGQLDEDEICYLKAGDFRIECYVDGSYLTLGPDDSNPLLSDNPASGLSAADGKKPTDQAVQLYGVLFLVGGSVDRLPQALADYLENPGMHLNEAVSLALLLMGNEPVELRGQARGGSFSVTMVLTDTGRDKLLEALNDVGQSAGNTQMVLHRGAWRTLSATHISGARRRTPNRQDAQKRLTKQRRVR